MEHLQWVKRSLTTIIKPTGGKTFTYNNHEAMEHLQWVKRSLTTIMKSTWGKTLPYNNHESMEHLHGDNMFAVTKE